jgi:hypothetical protein
MIILRQDPRYQQHLLSPVRYFRNRHRKFSRPNCPIHYDYWDKEYNKSKHDMDTIVLNLSCISWYMKRYLTQPTIRRINTLVPTVSLYEPLSYMYIYNLFLLSSHPRCTHFRSFDHDLTDTDEDDRHTTSCHHRGRFSCRVMFGPQHRGVQIRGYSGG